jgi:hypothetical protein
MHLTCSQEMLAAALQKLHRLKPGSDPDAACVHLTAIQGDEDDPRTGTLSLLRSGAWDQVGMHARLTASVWEEGTIAVPIARLAEYVQLLRSGSPLTLRHEARTPDDPDTRVACIEQNASGTTLKTRARFVEYHSERETVLEWASWNTTSQELATTVPFAELRRGLECCIPLAKEGGSLHRDLPELSMVLFEGRGSRLTLRAAVRTTILSYQIPLMHPVSFPFCWLVPGDLLGWICKALPTEGTCTLALGGDTRGSGNPAVLLIRSPAFTLFCRGVETPTHPAWRWPLDVPAQADLLVERLPLQKALRFAQTACRTSEGLAAVRLSTSGAQLVLRPLLIVKASQEEQRAHTPLEEPQEVLRAHTPPELYGSAQVPLLTQSTSSVRAAVAYLPEVHRLTRLAREKTLGLQVGIHSNRSPFLRVTQGRLTAMTRLHRLSVHAEDAERSERLSA